MKVGAQIKWIELGKRLRLQPQARSVARRHLIRIAVGSAGGPQASIWRVWSTGNDVYVAARHMAAIEKFSFHQSGICRKAFTESHGKPLALADRATIKWRRLPTQPQGFKRGKRVLYLAFPTDFLSTDDLEPLGKPVRWIKPAPSGMATYIEMFFTREDALAVQWHFAMRGQRSLIDFMPLPNGEHFVVCAHYDRWENRNILMPASHHEKRDLMFSAHDPNGTGRPIRLFLSNNPKDGDYLKGQELGGYTISKEQLAAFGHPFRTFSRREVLAR